MALSSNLTDYALLLTPNLDFQYAMGRHFTVEAGIKYNNWSFFQSSGNESKNRQKTLHSGIRWWPWYSYSGWWAGSSLQYQEYDRGGFLSAESEAGDAIGLSLSAGYSLQLAKCLNLDFGFGIWAGSTVYTLYECPQCGRVLEEGSKTFFLPNEARVAVQFIF